MHIIPCFVELGNKLYFLQYHNLFPFTFVFMPSDDKPEDTKKPQSDMIQRFAARFI